MNLRLKKTIFFSFLFFLLMPLLAEAIEIENPLKYDTFEEIVEGIIDFIFVIAVALVPLMIIVAGFYFVTAGGDPGRIRTAKQIMFWTIIGFAIVLLAKGLITVIKQILGVPEG
ncbi:hypothetical protein KJA15_01940 [Patescibacteria group bacterium]|nr:hypothetical protein [Patescibacteria group bacterium]